MSRVTDTPSTSTLLIRLPLSINSRCVIRLSALDASTPIDGRYTDNDSWSTNEIDVVWQAAALYNLHFAQWLSHQGSSRTNTSTLSTTPADR